MASQQAVVNRALRNIQSELEFLQESGLITASTLSQITALLPTAPSSTTTTPVPAPKKWAPVNTNPIIPAPSADVKPPLPTRVPSEKSPAPTRAVPPPPPAAPAIPPPPAYEPVTLATALYAYSSGNEADLEFAAGERIEIVDKSDRDWWLGKLYPAGTKSGYFPANRVELLAGDDKKAPVPPSVGYGRGGNMMTDVAHSSGSGSTWGQQQQGGENDGEKSKVSENTSKFGKKLGNAAIFGAGATIGSKIVNGIF